MRRTQSLTVAWLFARWPLTYEKLFVEVIRDRGLDTMHAKLNEKLLVEPGGSRDR